MKTKRKKEKKERKKLPTIVTRPPKMQAVNPRTYEFS